LQYNRSSKQDKDWINKKIEFVSVVFHFFFLICYLIKCYYKHFGYQQKIDKKMNSHASSFVFKVLVNLRSYIHKKQFRREKTFRDFFIHNVWSRWSIWFSTWTFATTKPKTKKVAYLYMFCHDKVLLNFAGNGIKLEISFGTAFFSPSRTNRSIDVINCDYFFLVCGTWILRDFLASDGNS
jgi:hypothetical protein